jgi:hypothetical protein
VNRILAHLRLPLTPELVSDGSSVGFDVTGEPVPSWVVGTDPEPDGRGPPDRWDSVEPPAHALDMRREGAQDRAHRGS